MASSMKRQRKVATTTWDDDQFRARCRVAAVRRGWTVEELCERAGLDRFYLGKTAALGRRVDAVIALAHTAEVTLTWLAGVEEAPDLLDPTEAARLGAVADVAAHLYCKIRSEGFDADTGAIVRAVLDVVGRRRIKPTAHPVELPPEPPAAAEAPTE
jgi:hypothetical protein